MEGCFLRRPLQRSGFGFFGGLGFFLCVVFCGGVGFFI